MTPYALFKLIADLENDLADFYQSIGRIDRLKPFADIFSYMADHSQRHARRIARAAPATDLPPLDIAPVEALHRRLKSALREQLRDAKDPREALHKLAHTEEIVGRLYQSLAAHYRRRADTYARAADQLEALAREEFDHRDYIREQ